MDSLREMLRDLVDDLRLWQIVVVLASVVLAGYSIYLAGRFDESNYLAGILFAGGGIAAAFTTG